MSNGYWWLILFSVMSLSGIFGSLARYVWEQSFTFKRERFIKQLLVGIAAGLMVPILLNALSSPLIVNTYTDKNNLYVLIGLCIGAAFLVKPFSD